MDTHFVQIRQEKFEYGGFHHLYKTVIAIQTLGVDIKMMQISVWDVSE